MADQPAAAGAPAATGAPSPSTNPATVSKADYDALLEKHSALDQRLAAMERAEENRKAQAQRQRQKARQAGGTDAEGVDDDGEPTRAPAPALTTEQAKDPAALQRVIADQEARLRAAEGREAQRTKGEFEKDRKTEIDRLMGVSNIVAEQRDFLRDHLELRVRKNDDGVWIHDDGRRVRNLDEVVREFAAKPAFKASTAVPGPGTFNAGPVQAVTDAATKIDPKLPAEERIRQYRQLQSGGR